MRKSTIVGFGVALLLILGSDEQVVSQPPTTASLPTDLGTRRFGEDWPIFLGPTADSKSTETGIIDKWADNGLRVLWHIALQQSYGTCTISRGRLFQFDSEPSERGENVGKVMCLNSETGRQLWEYKYDYEYTDQYGYNSGPRCSPIVDGDRVYAYGVDGRLICLKAVDGEEVWTVDANKKFRVVKNFFGVGSNPVVMGDLLIAMVGGSPSTVRRIDRARGNGTGIVAFNKFDGNVVYQLSNELASYASLKLIQGDQRWCFAFTRSGLLGFDPRSGEQEFFFPWRARILESVNASVPVVFDNKVFISETYGPGSALLDFTQLNDNIPKVVWKDEEKSRKKSMQTHWNTAIHHDGYIYGSSGRHQHNAELRCIEAKTGRVMWSKSGLSRCSLLLVDNRFVCLSETGRLSLLNATPKAYQRITEVELRDKRKLLRPPAWAAPVLSHGLLYVRGNDKLVCAELIPNRE